MNHSLIPHRHSELKNSEANQRIEQIKRKYDTPSRRERIESLKRSTLDSQKRSNRLEDKENQHSRALPSFGSNHMRENTYNLQESTYSPGLKDSMLAPSMKESVIATRLERNSFKEEEKLGDYR